MSQDTDLSAEDLRELVDEFRAIVREATGRDFPADPYEQLDLSIKAVFGSWFGKRAMDYRNSQKIAHDLGTAVNVVTMVFGDMGDDSGRCRVHPRPNTGEVALRRVPHQCPGRGRGGRHPDGAQIAQMQTDMPEVYADFQRIGQQLERHYRDVQDLEFTIERGRLYMLQTRSAKRTAAAAVRIAVDMVEEGLISKEAVARIEPGPRRPAPARYVRPGRAQGRHEDRQRTQRLARRGRWAGRVRRRHGRRDGSTAARRSSSFASRRPRTTSTAWPCRSIITARGGATSHAAVVARQIGKPCVAGSSDLLVDYAGKQAHCRCRDRVQGGDWVSLDGSTGALYLGQLPTVEARFEDQPELQTILGWADGIRRMQVWTNADKPEEAAQARGYGAQGIGLCHRAHVPRGRAPRDRA